MRIAYLLFTTLLFTAACNSDPAPVTPDAGPTDNGPTAAPVTAACDRDRAFQASCGEDDRDRCIAECTSFAPHLRGDALDQRLDCRVGNGCNPGPEIDCDVASVAGLTPTAEVELNRTRCHAAAERCPDAPIACD